MFGKQNLKELKQQSYDRVYQLHEDAQFLCYIDEVYEEPFKGASYIKLEGVVAKGQGDITQSFELYSCNGRKKADVTMEEFYLGSDPVTCLYAGDKRIALYPKEQDVSYKAGDLLCRTKD